MARVSADEFKKTQANLKVSLDLDDQLTWAELFRFVDLARSGGYIEDQPVAMEYDPAESDSRVVGMSIYLHPEQVAPVPSVASVAPAARITSVVPVPRVVAPVEVDRSDLAYDPTD